MGGARGVKKWLNFRDVIHEHPLGAKADSSTVLLLTRLLLRSLAGFIWGAYKTKQMARRRAFMAVKVKTDK